MSDLDPLPQDLRALFAEERASYPDAPEAKSRVHRRLEAAILFGAAGVAGATIAAAAGAAAKTGALSVALEAAKGAKLWIALSLIAGIAVGETHARLTAPPPPVVTPVSAVGVAPPRAPTSAASARAPADDPPTIDVSSLPSSAPAPNTVTPPSPSTAPLSAPSAGPSDLAAEQGLIDTARSALSRGRADDALRAADDHARRFPRGRLAEERETLAIQALLLTGKRGEAEARGQGFHKAYPQSLYGNAVDALLRPRNDAGP